MSLLVWFCLFCSPATGAFATLNMHQLMWLSSLCGPMLTTVSQSYYCPSVICMYNLYEVVFCLWFNAYQWQPVVLSEYLYVHTTSMWLSSVCGSMLTCGSQCGDTATCITLDFYIFRVQKIYQWVHYSKSHQYFFITFYIKNKNNIIKLHVNACTSKKDY